MFNLIKFEIMKILIKITFLVLFIIPLNVYSQKGLVINSDAYLKLNSDVFIKIGDDLNFINNSQNNLFGGKIILNGNNLQLISGSQESEFGNLEIHNPTGIDLQNNVYISNELILSDGILNINDHFFTIRESAFISGSFSSSAMINADADGMLIQEISSPGTFLFPLGDMTSGNDYSPVEIIFNSGTFSSSALKVNLKNEKHPNNPAVSDYINRYWTLEAIGISDFDADITLTYESDDITGTENNIYGAHWSGTAWTQMNLSSNFRLTGNINEFGDFTGADESIFSDINIVQQKDIILFYSEGNIYYENISNIDITDIRMYSVNGKLLSQFKVDAQSSYIPIKNISSGVYIISIVTKKNIIQKKLFI